MKRDAGDFSPPPTLSQYFPLVGGLDVESAQLARQPGVVMGSLNYEGATESGYERLGGFERFDGHPRPSDATFAILQATVAFTGVAVGNTITGATSGATAKVVQVRSTSQLVATRQTGVFTMGENIQVGGVTKGVYSQLAHDFNSADDNTLSALAATNYRADIAAVPGEGNLLGVAALAGSLYAWRNNVGSTAAVLFKSTTAGWTTVALLKEVAFTVGSGTPPAELATITQGGVTARVRRVVTQSGSWDGSDAAGRFIVDTVAGGNFAAGAFTAGVTATASGAQTQITLSPNGRYDTRNFNFTGSTDTERIYGADGVNRGFEFDGSVLVPINTGMTVDKPTHVECHVNQLFFSFRGSAQHSAPGTPYVWDPVLDAGELSTGQDITGYEVLPGGTTGDALLITSLTRTLVLYGTGVDSWKLVTFNPRVGAQRWSLLNLGTPLVFDSQGIATVTQAQQFGNFLRAPISARIRRLLAGKTVQAGVVNRAKLRARLFFTDGTFVTITPVGDNLEFMGCSYDKTVTCTCEAVIAGQHRTFFGASDGFVYEADRGRSFDGQTVPAFAKLAFNFVKSPGLRKRFRSADIEVKPQSAMTLRVQGEYSLGDPNVALTDVYVKDIRGLGGQWDITNYDECYYDAPAQAATRVRLDGTGTSLSLTCFSNSAVELPHELQSVTTFYNNRRLDRG